jgi:NAD(P)-dependent dehydrogenase (short-subunit alcohol dehydrogenase family)
MTELTDFKDRVAVVTGGASGIGLGIARALLAEGAKVVIADIEEDTLRGVADEIGAVAMPVDVSSAAQMAALAEAVLARFGRVDIVCNNAGVAPKVRIQDATLDDWRWMIDVNLWGVIHGINAFLPLLLANQTGGYIVNTSSAGGFVTGPMIGTYCATKAAVVALSESLNMELQMQGANIGVTILAPGTVRTNLHTSVRNRPSGLSDVNANDIDFKKAGALAGPQRWITADSVGPVVIDAMRRGALYVTTHDDIADMFEKRAGRILEQLRAPIPATVNFD